jgi:hypothetical protein
MKHPNRKKSRRSDRPTLPELDQTERSVLHSLAYLQSRRSYQHAMDGFIDWYCSEPRPRTQPRRGAPLSAKKGAYPCTLPRHAHPRGRVGRQSETNAWISKNGRRDGRPC